MASVPPGEPFLWGQGGQRLTPEEIALQRRQAEQQRMMGSDFSPVGSVWEGLGRVVQGYSGGLADRRADRAAEANRAENESIAELLMGQGEAVPDNNVVLQALLNPYASDEVRGLAQLQYQQMNQPFEPSNDFERALVGSGVQPGSPEWVEHNASRLDYLLNPPEYRQGPDGRFYRIDTVNEGMGAQTLGETLPEGWTIEGDGAGNGADSFQR